MEKESETLRKKLLEIRDTLLELEFLKKDILMLVDDNEEYFENMVKKSRFLYRLYLNYTKLFVIDLHKLIDKDENYNIHNLINYCKSNIRRIDWSYPISLTELNHCESKLIDISSHFPAIIDLRNKVYAHNDKNKSKLKFDITLNEFWVVLKELQEIFSKINLCFDNHQWIFHIQYQRPQEIKFAYKYKKLKQLYLEHAAEQTNIDITKFRKIMLE